MDSRQIIQLLAAIGALAASLGIGNLQGVSREQAVAEGWCGQALATQAQYYQEMLNEHE